MNRKTWAIIVIVQIVALTAVLTVVHSHVPRPIHGGCLPPPPPLWTFLPEVIKLYKVVNGEYPPDLGTLIQWDQDSHGENRGIIRPDMLLDSWSNSLRYARTEKHFTLRSAGPDGQFESDDDIALEYGYRTNAGTIRR
jgi:hypothetical protein